MSKVTLFLSLKYPTNTTSYIVLYCNRLIILSTQIIHKKQIKYKDNIFNLTVQYLEKYSTTSYISAAFMLASAHPGLEIKIPCYFCTVYNTLQ